jgi:hypothetical protein
VNRSLAIVGAVAIIAAQPAVTLGAHPGAFLPAHPAPIFHPEPRAGSAQNGFRMPFNVHVQPKPLTTFGLHPLLSLNHWYYWQPRPNYLSFPTLYQPACYANTNAWGSASDQDSTSMTLGSLVDGKANILSPQSFNSGFAASNVSATNPSPFSLQAGFTAPGCGPSSFMTF